MTQTSLSPFEFKEELINLASSQREKLMLNAGRGNPNFLATQPRHAFLKLGEFALLESERAYAYLNQLFGGAPEKAGIVGRFDQFCLLHQGEQGVAFLQSIVTFVDDHLGVDKADFLHEITEAFLGCNYPYPPRMLKMCEQVVQRYLQQELFNRADVELDFDLFATEGGTAAMTYLFQTLSLNGLLKRGHKIAMITPIFSPYLEIPVLPEYEFEIVHIHAHEDQQWQVPADELAKLKDQNIKLLCMVNPSNPPSVKMNNATLAGIEAIISQDNPNLMIITDDVYATFSNHFESVFARCPKNTICVYSFSKYFGATGWRLGTIAVHQDNVFDQMLQALPEDELQKLDQRYSSLTNQPREVKFIDRLVADSRTVALNHTAGLSLPQQLQMTLFALASLIDDNDQYRQDAKKLIHRRYEILLRAISPKLVHLIDAENLVGYYVLLDLPQMAEILYSKAVADDMLQNYNAADFLRRLAQETGVVLLPGKGFDVDHPSARVSLANLRECDYRQIGLAIRQVLSECNDMRPLSNQILEHQ